MNTRNPIPFSAIRPPRPAEVRNEMGRAAGLRDFASRPLPFLRSMSEPQRIMLSACISCAGAATFGAIAAVAFVAGWKPLFPLLPLTFLGAAVVQAFETRHFFAEMRDHERNVADHYGRVARRMADEIAQDRIERAIQHISDARDLEGARVSSGAMAGDGGKCMSPAIDAPNVLYPQFPDFWR